jgi:hypothetical protein
MLDLSLPRGARGDARRAVARSCSATRRTRHAPSETPLLTRRCERRLTTGVEDMKLVHVRLIATVNALLALITLITLLSALACGR